MMAGMENRREAVNEEELVCTMCLRPSCTLSLNPPQWQPEITHVQSHLLNLQSPVQNESMELVQNKFLSG